MAGMWSPILRNLTVAVVAAAAAACGSQEPSLHDYRLRHQLVVESGPVVLSLSARTGDERVRPEDIPRLRDFAQRFLNSGEGGVEILVSGDQPGRRSFAEALNAELIQFGIAPQKLVVRNTDAEGKVTSVLRFEGYHVRLPDCSAASPDSSPAFLNADRHDFGCAQQRNIGLMIANPHDLIRMRDGDMGRDGNRSVDVIEKYRAGKLTGSAASDGNPTAIGPAGKPAAK